MGGDWQNSPTDDTVEDAATPNALNMANTTSTEWTTTPTDDGGENATAADDSICIRAASRLFQATITREIVYETYAYASINGEVYGEPDDTKLMVDGVASPLSYAVLDFLQKNLKSEFTLKGKIARDMSPQRNPQGFSHYIFSFSISSSDMFDLKVHAPGTFKVPPQFNAPSDWTSPQTLASIALVTFRTGNFRALNATIPKLQNATAEAKLKELIQYMRNAKKQNTPLFFEILVLYEGGKDGRDWVLDMMQLKVNNDMTRNPEFDWCKDSPVAHTLQQNNIFPYFERPLLSRENLILKLRRTYDDPFGFKLRLIHAVEDEFVYVSALAADVLFQPMMVTFEAIPGSAFKTSGILTDNNLPKLYIISVEWDSSLDAPTLNDSYTVFLPFDVPPPPPPATDKRKPRIRFVDNGNDGVIDKGSFLEFVESDEEEFTRKEEAQLAQKIHQRKCWHAKLLPPSDLNVNGQPLFVITRPRDSLYEGAEGDPFVSTVVPGVETRISNVSRRQKYIKEEAPRHRIKFEKLVSDQNHKDYIRTINLFFDGFDENLSTSVLRHHLVDLMTHGDLDAPFPVRNFFHTCATNYGVYADGLTELQKNLFLEMKKVEHGMILIEGAPAGGKSFLAIRAVLAHATKAFPKEDLQNVVLVTSDTNSLVNELADRIKTEASKEKYGIKHLNIVRIHSLPAEERKFTNSFIPPELQSYFQELPASDFLIMNLLNEVGKAKEAEIKQGDPRFDHKIKDLSLHEHMCRELVADPEQWSSLKISLARIRHNGNVADESAKEIKSEIQRLMVKVLRSAHIIAGTCDMLLRPVIASAIAPSLLFKDEDARSPKQKFIGLAASYPSLQFIILAADMRQKKPYSEVQRRNVPAAFSATLMYTAFQFFQDAGVKTLSLHEQQRMHNSAIVKQLSNQYYNGAMTDGKKDEPTSPQATFITRFNIENFNVHSNVATLILSGTRSEKEEGGTSLINKGMQYWAINTLRKLKQALDTKKDLGFDPKDFTVGVVCSYLGVINWANVEFPKALDARFRAITVEMVQGMDFNFVFGIVPNYRFTTFVGDTRDRLVAETRWKHGYTIVMTDDSLKPGTYKMTHDAFMYSSDKTKHLFTFHQFCKEKGWTYEVDLPKDELSQCGKCGEFGHTPRDERCPGFSLGWPCQNCHEYGHGYGKCKKPKLAAKPPPPPVDPNKPRKEIKCYHCEGAHHRSDCPNPWCGDCRSIAHSWLDCPVVKCKKCGALGHRANNPKCPKFSECEKCGGPHNPKYCKSTFSRSTTFKQPWDNHIETDFTQKLAAMEDIVHRRLNPDLANLEDNPDDSNETDGNGGWVTDHDPGNLSSNWEIDPNNGTVDQFGSDFPNGYTLIPTESTGLQCGLFALCHSIKYQGRHLPVPTVNELHTIATTGTVHQRVQELGLDEAFDRNYLVDHLDAVLQEYCRGHWQNIRLGIHTENGQSRVVFGGEAASDVYTIWIHNDDAQNDDKGVLGHYSGMRRKGVVLQSNQLAPEMPTAEMPTAEKLAAEKLEKRFANDKLATEKFTAMLISNATKRAAAKPAVGYKIGQIWE